MDNNKELADQRENKRFQVPKDAFAALRPDYVKVGQIINISMGGIELRYLGSEVPSNGSELDIFLAGRTFYLYKVPFETVWDLVTNSSINMKVCGLQFRDLTPHQIAQLKYFIQDYAIGEA